MKCFQKAIWRWCLVINDQLRSSDDCIGYMVPHCQNVQKQRNRKRPSWWNSLAELVHATSLQCVWLLVTPWAAAGCARTELCCGVSAYRTERRRKRHREHPASPDGFIPSSVRVSGHSLRLVNGSPTVFGPPDSLQLSGQALQRLATEGSLSWNVADEEHRCQRGHLCFCGPFARGL